MKYKLPGRFVMPSPAATGNRYILDRASEETRRNIDRDALPHIFTKNGTLPMIELQLK